jgi:hypothetical protein
MRLDFAMSMLLALVAVTSGCARPDRTPSPLDGIAESYVKLVLAIGRHDPLYVDAYYGPAAWKGEAERGAPVPLDELLGRTRALTAAVRAADGPADRKRYLEKQLVAVETHLRSLSGERFPLTEECRLLYDATPVRHDVAEFEAAQKELDRLVPGTGPLAERLEGLRKAVQILPDRVEATVRAALGAARSANVAFVHLPAGENFETLLVHDKPWGAYNWYLGGYRSRIELNLDLPVQLNRLLGTMCHEGYPGHHVYNVLLEHDLVRGKGWVEYTVYPLYSPQSMLAEGTANAGEDILFTDDERRHVLTDVLAPVAGISPGAVLGLDRVQEAGRPLRYVNGEAAHLLLDDGRPDAEVVAFLMKWGLENEDRAKKSVAFARTYRSYVFNYTLGEDLVRAWIGDGPDRRQRFYGLLNRPVVPSDLAGGR